MLVVSRKCGERIDIDGGFKKGGSKKGGATIIVTWIGPGKVRLGIEAHPDVRINRREVEDRMREEQDNQTQGAKNASD